MTPAFCAILLFGLVAGPLAPGLPPRVVSVENKGLLFTDNPAGVNGIDCGYSTPIGDRTLWLFGDVFLQDPRSPLTPFVGAVSNCGLTLQSGRGADPLKRFKFLTGPNGIARQLIPLAPDEGQNIRLWPFGGWFDPHKRRVCVYYATVRTSGRGPLDFQIEGFSLARLDVEKLDTASFERLKTEPGSAIWWPSGGPVFGSAVFTGAEAKDPYLYVVGYEERSRRKVGKLARVARNRIEALQAYEYYSGPGPRWSKNIAQAADIEGLSDYPSELSVAFNPYVNGYLAVHTIGLSGRVRLSMAPDPWGPYRSIGEIGAPPRAFSRGFCYAGKEHPELREQGGRVIYVTYVDSERYWLQLLKVTLER